MKTVAIETENRPMAEWLPQEDSEEIVYITRDGQTRFVVVPLDEGDAEVLAMQNNPALMTFIDECVQRARKGPTKSLADIKALFSADSDNPDVHHPADSLSIPDLLARARTDDPRQLDLLFAQCRNFLGIVARAQVESWLRAKVDASDLIQQTLLEAYRDFQRFRGSTEAEWLAWLRQILTHNAANFVRHYRATGKRQAHREVSLAQPGDDTGDFRPNDPADTAESPSQQLMRKEREWLAARGAGKS